MVPKAGVHADTPSEQLVEGPIGSVRCHSYADTCDADPDGRLSASSRKSPNEAALDAPLQ